MRRETWSENAEFALVLLQLVEKAHPRRRARAPELWDGARALMQAYAWRQVEWRALRFAQLAGREQQSSNVALFVRALLLALQCAPPPPPPAATWPHVGAHISSPQETAAPEAVEDGDDMLLYGEDTFCGTGADVADDAAAVRRGQLLYAVLTQTATVLREQLASPTRSKADVDAAEAAAPAELHRPRWSTAIPLTPLLAAALAEALAGHSSRAGDAASGRARFGLMHLTSVEYEWPEAPPDAVASPAHHASDDLTHVEGSRASADTAPAGAGVAWHERLWQSLRSSGTPPLTLGGARPEVQQIDKGLAEASKGAQRLGRAPGWRDPAIAAQPLSSGREAAIADVLDLLIAVGAAEARGVGAPCAAEWTKYSETNMAEGVGPTDNGKLWRALCAIESWQGQRQQWEFRWLGMLEATCTAAGRDASALRAALHARLDSNLQGKQKKEQARAEAATAPPPLLERQHLPWEAPTAA